MAQVERLEHVSVYGGQNRFVHGFRYRSSHKLSNSRGSSVMSLVYWKHWARSIVELLYWLFLKRYINTFNVKRN